jgi:hypothetical protein
MWLIKFQEPRDKFQTNTKTQGPNPVWNFEFSICDNLLRQVASALKMPEGDFQCKVIYIVNYRQYHCYGFRLKILTGFPKLELVWLLAFGSWSFAVPAHYKPHTTVPILPFIIN